MQEKMVGFRLSPQQERLWHLQQADPKSPYVSKCSILIDGNLNKEILQSAIQDVIDRHEILRTRFHRLPEMTVPVQVIGDGGALAIDEHDLSGSSPAEQRAKLEELFDQSGSDLSGFDEGLLLQLSLAKLSASRHVIIISLPALCADAATLAILAKEISRCYQSRAEGRELAGEPAQYADLSEWQNELLESDETRAGRDYWRAQYSQVSLSAKLPFEDHSSRPTAFDPRSISRTTGRDLTYRLEALASDHNTPLSMLLLACWCSLLWRLTGQAELTVGAAFDGRKYEELEDALGPFVKYLPITTSLDRHQGFSRLLNQINDVAHEARGWEEFFSWEDFAASSDTADVEYFHFGFDFDEWPASLSAGELSFSTLGVYTCADRFDLRLSCARSADSLVLGFHFAAGTLSAEDAARLADEFHRLLESVVHNPEAKVGEIEILTDAERRQVLVDFNRTEVDYPEGKYLHTMFEEQVKQMEEEVAVVFGHEQLTYGQLDRRSNQLARRLRHLGVGPDVVVAICMERSPEMVIALLGVLKAGGAYLPVDPAYPTERVDYMLSDSGARLVLTQQRLAEGPVAGCQRVLCLDTEWGEIESESDEGLEQMAMKESAAYVIYTSGSTGKPKGVVVEHRAITNHMQWMSEALPLTTQDVVLQKTPFGFDASVWEFYAPLLAGARLVMARPGGQADTRYLVDEIGRQGVTILQLVPSLLRLLLREEGIEESRSLRRVLCGGEELTASLREEFYGRMEAELVNLYGPTEAAIDTITWEVERDSKASVVPIGKPVSNTQIYILDEGLQPVPIGVAGEIHISGECLGRGYLNRGDITAESFIPNPFSDRPGARMYKTGDLARHMRDGVIDYIGRKDFLVKFRGYRIELGEIESILNQHEGVKQAVVIVREDVADDKRLVAYIVPEEQKPSTDQLRSYIKDRLPEYMLPSAYVMVEALPRTPSGKIDRRALPAPGPERPDIEVAYVAPSTEIEKALAAIWCDVLGLEEVGIHDNFFGLGGDSIRSIQVVALAKERGLTFALEDLFQHQTIAELVSDIKVSELAGSQALKTEPFSLISEEDRLKLPEDVEDAYPLTMLQAGMIYHLELTPDSPTYHNVNSYKLKCRFEPEAFQQAVQIAVGRHANLRTSFDLTTYTQPLQLVHTAAFLPVSVEDIRDLSPEDQEQTVETFLQSEYNRLFDLSAPPLLRFNIHRLSDDSIQFTLTECHAIADGWSLTSTLSEIFGHYFALVKGESPSIEEPVTSSFRDYVLLERQALQSEECRDFWVEKLNSAVFTGLPRWGHEETGLTRKTRKHNSLIQSEMYHRLKRLALSLGVPLKSVLLAAHVKVMSILSGRPDILTGLVTNGRPEEVGGEQVRGLFLNTVPFGIDLADHSWADLVRGVFAAEVELSPYRRYPMAALQKELKGQPLFEVMFNYLNFHSVEDLLASGNVEVLKGKDLSITNLTLHVTFFQAPIATPYITLLTECGVPEWTEEYIDAIHGYYHRILEAMVTDPLSRHDSQTFLSSKELYQLLVEWNDTQRGYEADHCIHELFEAQARRTPDAIALRVGDQAVSYRELNVRANRLAHRLIELGAGPEQAVAVCLTRRAELVVSLLAVMKAGSAYVPLDPAYPPQRTDYILRSCGAGLVITERGLLGGLADTSARLLCVDAEGDESIWREGVTSQGEGDPRTGVSSSNLAYIIYTSGSTGEPKGVAIQHSSAAVFLKWAADQFSGEEMGGVLASTSVCFDLSVFEIFGPLCVGGKLILVENALELERAEARGEVRLINTVPSAMNELVRQGAVPETVMTVNLAGEALGRRLVEQIYSLEHVGKVMNLYGPSEDTTYTTYTEVRRGEAGAVTIGRPVAETRVYILDGQMQAVPIGVSGELYTSGKGLARCYDGRAEQTAERFVPDPFSTEGGARMYRTGDLCRFRADGEIDYLGRVDHQVKVRGYRIELGEVEAALAGHPMVKEAVVVMREERGDKKIIAYVVEEFGAIELTASEMRRQLREKLPDYMVPTAFVKLDKLPLTPNGKVDRKALPVPDSLRPELEIGYVAPQTEMERIIADVCQQVLNIEKVGIHDNFFDLGAHSILLLQIHSRLEEVFEMKLSMTDMFEYPSINALSKYLTQAKGEEPSLQQGKSRAEARKKSAIVQNQARRRKGTMRKGKGSGGMG